MRICLVVFFVGITTSITNGFVGRRRLIEKRQVNDIGNELVFNLRNQINSNRLNIIPQLQPNRNIGNNFPQPNSPNFGNGLNFGFPVIPNAGNVNFQPQNVRTEFLPNTRPPVIANLPPGLNLRDQGNNNGVNGGNRVNFGPQNNPNVGNEVLLNSVLQLLQNQNSNNVNPVNGLLNSGINPTIGSVVNIPSQGNLNVGSNGILGSLSNPIGINGLFQTQGSLNGTNGISGLFPGLSPNLLGQNSSSPAQPVIIDFHTHNVRLLNYDTRENRLVDKTHQLQTVRETNEHQQVILRNHVHQHNILNNNHHVTTINRENIQQNQVNRHNVHLTKVIEPYVHQYQQTRQNVIPEQKYEIRYVPGGVTQDVKYTQNVEQRLPVVINHGIVNGESQGALPAISPTINSNAFPIPFAANNVNILNRPQGDLSNGANSIFNNPNTFGGFSSVVNANRGAVGSNANNIPNSNNGRFSEFSPIFASTENIPNRISGFLPIGSNGDNDQNRFQEFTSPALNDRDSRDSNLDFANNEFQRFSLDDDNRRFTRSNEVDSNTESQYEIQPARSSFEIHTVTQNGKRKIVQ